MDDQNADDRDLIKKTVFREFCEEIFGLEEYVDLGNYSYLTSTAEYEILSNHAKLYYIGSGFDAFNTKFEILTVLIVDCGENEVKSAIAEGIAKSVENSEKQEGKIKEVLFSKENLCYYYGSMKTTFTGKEIMRLAIEKYPEIEGKCIFE